MKHLFIYTISLFCISSVFLSCDSTTSPKDLFEDGPVIRNFVVSPQNVEFSSLNDGVKDTTVLVTFSAITQNLANGEVPRITITDRVSGQVVLQENMETTNNANEFILEIPFQTKTTFFQDYRVNAIVQKSDGSDFSYALASLKITGFSEEPPQILEANNPEELQRPSQGDAAVGFLAKVSDIEGMDTIEGVFIRLISRESGEVSGSPYRLYDNATNGDQTASDSTYTRVFRFNSGNSLQTYDVLYYAIDRGGLVSDTVSTTFSIVE